MLSMELEKIYLILAFVVPGFIFHSSYSSIVRVQSQRADLDLLRFIATSVTLFVVLSPIIYWLLSPKAQEIFIIWRLFLWFGVFFFLPFFLGVLWGGVQWKGGIHRLLSALGINSLHHSPTAWDWQFGRMKEGHYVIVTLNDSSEVAGFFGSNSLASSVVDSQDIYLERVYQIKEEEKWVETERTAGILIAKNNIKHIEFRK